MSSGLGPSLFGAKWRFVGESESGFAMSIYPQWMSHLVRSSVDRGLADPGSQWFVPIEMEIKLGEGQLDLEVGRRLESGGPRTWEEGSSARTIACAALSAWWSFARPESPTRARPSSTSARAGS